jgi:hypothetical protein
MLDFTTFFMAVSADLGQKFCSHLDVFSRYSQENQGW